MEEVSPMEMAILRQQARIQTDEQLEELNPMQMAILGQQSRILLWRRCGWKQQRLRARKETDGAETKEKRKTADRTDGFDDASGFDDAMETD